MNFATIIVIVIIIAILAFAVSFVVREKKSGKKCIGCPHAGTNSCELGTSCSIDNIDKNDTKNQS